MNMSTNHSTKNPSYSHLSASEQGKISTYLKMGKKSTEIARLLGRHRSTIIREIQRKAVTQVQDKNGKQPYFANSGQRIYETNRKNCTFHKLKDCSPNFFEELTKKLKAKPRCHSADTFIQTYKEKHPLEILPSTKIIYRYIKDGLLSINPIDLPKMVRIRKSSTPSSKTNKKILDTSVQRRLRTALNLVTERLIWHLVKRRGGGRYPDFSGISNTVCHNLSITE